MERGREREREGEGQGERKGGIVGGGGDALGDFASVLCTAIVHQSLLEAKPVRTEQRFLRDLSLSAGMPKRKFNPRGRERWMDGHPWPSTVVPSSRDASKRLRECLTSNVSCITAPKLISVFQGTGNSHILFIRQHFIFGHETTNKPAD